MYETINWMLKEMVMEVSKNQRDEFRKLLHVDIEHCVPYNVTGQRYKKEWEGNYFYFLDHNFKLLMVLKGSKFQREYEYIAPYIRTLPWNRKHFEPLATHILMITPEMRAQYKPRKKYRPLPKVDYKKSLNNRLEAYKTSKNDSITFDQMKEIIQKCMDFFNKNLFKGDEFAQQFKKYSLSTPNMMEVSRDFLDDVRRYVNAQKIYDKEYEKFGKEELWSKNWSAYYGDCASYKNRILNTKKLIDKLK